jgi:hypothetical protein
MYASDLDSELELMPLAIYAIKNCDTMKKARAWLEKHGVEHAYHHLQDHRWHHCAKFFGKRAARPNPSG